MGRADPLAPLIEAVAGERFDAPVLLWGFDADPRLLDLCGGAALAVTPFRGRARRLEALGLEVATELPEGGIFGAAFLALPRDRDEGRGMIALAARAVAPGGRIAVAVANDDGAAGHDKALRTRIGPASAIAKRHARAIAFTVRPETAEALGDWAAFATLAPAAHGGVALPGLFAHDRIDAGSALLARHLPEGASGRAADLGCGWGYLSGALLSRNPGLSSLDCLDHDARAIAAARINVHAPLGATLDFHWADVAAGEVEPRRYDIVVSNPPFHQGRAAEPALGVAFVAAAARALRPGGTAYFVANRGLPYDGPMQEAFRSVERVADEGGFKVIRARR